MCTGRQTLEQRRIMREVSDKKYAIKLLVAELNVLEERFNFIESNKVPTKGRTKLYREHIRSKTWS